MAGRADAGVIPPDALALVPGCEGGAAPLAASRLAGGTLHRTWRIDTHAGRFVLRLEAAAAESLGPDRRRERRLHALASARGLAPRIVADEPSRGALVTEFIEARAWAASDLDDPRQLARMGATLVALRAVPFDAGDAAAFHIDFAERLTALAELVAECSQSERHEAAAIAARAIDAWHASSPERRPVAIVHDDLHHANVLDRGVGLLVLVDWEYAAIGDPLLDLASLLAYHPPARAHAALLLEASGLAAASVRELLSITRAFDALVHLWYRVRRLSGTADPGEIAAEAAALRRFLVTAEAVAGESRPTPAD